jgi:hypothetical protein
VPTAAILGLSGRGYALSCIRTSEHSPRTVATHPSPGGLVVLLGLLECLLRAVPVVHLAGLGRITTPLYEYPLELLEVALLLSLLALTLGLTLLLLLPTQVAFGVGLQLLVGPSIAHCLTFCCSFSMPTGSLASNAGGDLRRTPPPAGSLVSCNLALGSSSRVVAWGCHRCMGLPSFHEVSIVPWGLQQAVHVLGISLPPARQGPDVPTR